MRSTFVCDVVNEPKVIAGIEWKIVAAIGFFFGTAVLMFRAPAIVLIPGVLLMFLRGPARRDAMFLQIYLRHRAQRVKYSPAYITAKNLSFNRPLGFSRMQVL